MFRIDNDSVIDATIAGGPARYINHSCQVSSKIISVFFIDIFSFSIISHQYNLIIKMCFPQQAFEHVLGRKI